MRYILPLMALMWLMAIVPAAGNSGIYATDSTARDDFQTGIYTIDSTGQDCFQICQSWPPNPFDQVQILGFRILFKLPASYSNLLAIYEVTITILTPANDTVYSFGSSNVEPGTHCVIWDCEDSFIELPKGMPIYIFELKACNFNIDKVGNAWRYEVRLPFRLYCSNPSPDSLRNKEESDENDE